ncbi:MAG: sortase [Candidatus Microgenomates bacterium]|jgi:sortase A
MSQKTILRVAALISGISGIVILTGVIYPIVLYNTTYSKNYTKLVSPVNGSTTNATVTNPTQNVLGSSASGQSDTDASTWFTGGATKEDFGSSSINYYTLTIPKLDIDGATVAIGGDDLDKSLIQYPGTALPGKRGNAVIFGHSVLPLYNNPKSYRSIFTMLPTLTIGDQIFVNYDGVSYTYKVETMFEVLPTDIQVLDQDSSDSFLTLVTCVPPGDPWDPKRLIVRARVVPPNQNTNID